jgi:subtilisin
MKNAKERIVAILFVALVILSCSHIAVSVWAEPERRRVIIGFNGKPSTSLIQSFGGTVERQYHIIPAVVATLPVRAINTLKNKPLIEYIEEDVTVTISDGGRWWRNYGYLSVFALLDGMPISIPFYVDGSYAGVTPSTVFMRRGTYTVSATYNGETQEQIATVVGYLQIMMVTFEFVSTPPETGYLNVEAQLDDSTPVSANIEVYYNGNLYYEDTTPFTIEVEPDSYDLIATYEDQTQYRITEVIADQTTTELFIFESPTPPEQGTLDITTTPVTGEVFIDGVSEGLAPVTKNVDIGTYTVSFGDVSEYITPEPQTVEVYVNQVTYVEGVYELIPPPAQGTLYVTTTPVTGEVYIDGVSYGLAPVTTDIDVGTYTVSFGNVDDYITPSPQSAHVYENQTTSIEGVYEPAPIEDPEVPWGIDRIDADLAWGTTEGLNIQVAILDTGIDRDHPDLQDNILAGISFLYYSYPWMWNSGAYDDDHGHGTWCAGIVGAIENDVGVKGVAPVVDIVAVKVLDSSGSGQVSDIVAGIEWCIDNCIDVISMSFGSTSYSSTLNNACNEAYQNGIVLVSAAGNEGDGNPSTNDVTYPAKFSTVIAVSAIDESDAIASFSSDGSEVELSAPGVNIESTGLNGGYETHSGTSGACPHVAGTVALLISLDVTLPQFDGYDTNGDGLWEPIEVRNRLRDTADDLGTSGHDVFYGYGLVDTQEAVTGVETTP